MHLSRRVGITGIGIIGPGCIGKEDFWKTITVGPPAVAPITRFDATSYPCRIAAEIRDAAYRELIAPNKLRTATRTTHYALAAAELALRDARLSLDSYAAHERGVSFGTSLGGGYEGQQQYATLLEKGINRVNPFVANGTANHAPGMEIAIATACQGSHASFSTGCCASLHAIGYAADMVGRGEIECCITGGTEAPISPLVLATMCRTHEVSLANEDPAHASRPFDRGHSGLVLSEGSVVLVLEAIERARDRGAPIYAEIIGHTSSMDTLDLFRVDESGTAGARALHTCLARSGLSAADLDYVCANGNSLPSFDRKEVLILKQALGEFAPKVPISSIKGALGHPFGASAAFQAAASCLAIQRSLIPPTQNLRDPDPEYCLDFVPIVGRPATLRHVLVCSYSFGGLNAYLMLGSISSN